MGKLLIQVKEGKRLSANEELVPGQLFVLCSRAQSPCEQAKGSGTAGLSLQAILREKALPWHMTR